MSIFDAITKPIIRSSSDFIKATTPRVETLSKTKVAQLLETPDFAISHYTDNTFSQKLDSASCMTTHEFRNTVKDIYEKARKSIENK